MEKLLMENSCYHLIPERLRFGTESVTTFLKAPLTTKESKLVETAFCFCLTRRKIYLTSVKQKVKLLFRVIEK